MPGPAPKPTALKRLAGNPGKRPLNESEPQFKRVKLHAPPHLNEPAKVEWRRLAQHLYKLGMLTVIDRAALAAYCQAWGDWVEAEQHLETDGRVLVTDKGYNYINPWVSVRNNAVMQMDKFGSKFGYTPSDRSKIRADAETEEQSLADLLFEGVSDD